MTEWTERLRDAAFPADIPPNWPNGIGGYLPAPRAYNAWTPQDWARFTLNRKLPIWVAGLNGEDEAQAAINALRTMGVPAGVYTAVDMEIRVDKTYVTAYGNKMHDAGYKVWVYGSASTVFGNPALDGYWVADYAGIGPFMYVGKPGVEIRATQYQSGKLFDSSTVKDYTYDDGKWWV